MNIRDAKEQIKNAMQVYFAKDEFGTYIIPKAHQRPVFLMGPPGIGKTAIMEQIAQELDVALISYSMTHHTRQSALGLPFIVEKEYGGKKHEVSEYTMSEIIAAVYDMMEETGKKEGILFLDEINCVSETLAPVILQFLQYKIFGRHEVPDGWIVVTAGNPPEYNRSVREYDIATWDRLKRIDVEPDLDAWRDYAYKMHIHQAIMSYLEIKKGNFYKVETTVDGKRFVTARGWEDLSEILISYEKCGIKADIKLISQYLQDPAIATDFAAYYELFAKYKSDYKIPEILDGRFTEDIVDRAKEAKFDERHSLLGLIIYSLTGDVREIMIRENVIKELKNIISGLGKTAPSSKKPVSVLDELKNIAEKTTLERDRQLKAAGLSDDRRKEINMLISELNKLMESVKAETDKDGMAIVKDNYRLSLETFKKDVAGVKSKFSNAFNFCDRAFEDGQELLIFVTELTRNQYTAQFISHYGCDEYYAHNKELLFYERQQEIILELSDLGI